MNKKDDTPLAVKVLAIFVGLFMLAILLVPVYLVVCLLIILTRAAF